jgi:ATP-dependent Clp protease ATP-binding subunit ClpB
VDFRNTVLVMTSNVGSMAIFELAGRDPERARKEVFDALRAAFRPEFLNRIDDIVLFNPLGREQLEKIVDLQLAAVSKLLADRNVRIELTPAARALILAEGYDPAYGARPLRRTVQRMVQDPLAMEILEGRILPGDTIRVDADAAGKTTFERIVPAPAHEVAAAAQARGRKKN